MKQRMNDHDSGNNLKVLWTYRRDKCYDMVLWTSSYRYKKGNS